MDEKRRGGVRRGRWQGRGEREAGPMTRKETFVSKQLICLQVMVVKARCLFNTPGKSA